MNNKKDNFIIKAQNKFGSKFNYSKIEFINMNTKVEIICPVHGSALQTPKSHIVSGSGCKKCGYEISIKKNTQTHQEFIDKLKVIHNNKYNYDKTQYKYYKDKITVTCLIHGDFKITAVNHQSGHGCKKCVGVYQETVEEILNKFNKLHNNFYTYKFNQYKNNVDKIEIICPKHGTFKQAIAHHKKGHGCPKCSLSVGEKSIAQFLDEHLIQYIQEYKFEDCRSKKNWKLMFDFYLPDFNICIEFDGIQHFNSNHYFGLESFQATQENDKIKNQYCLDNNIGLIRIKYNQKNDIPKLLGHFIK